MLAGCRFSVHRGEHACNFIEQFGSLTEGAFKGQPFTLQEWQRDFLMRLFGWIKPSAEWKADVRRFRFAYLEVPKKNGKTPFVSAIGNYLFFADSHGRQINQHIAATTRKQADKLLVHAVRQIKNHPALRKLAQIRKLEGFHQINYGDNEWTVLAAEAGSADGINGHVLADELHRWRDDEFFKTLRYAIASQPEGLFLGITTAGDNPESICYQLHHKTIEVNAGRQSDEQFLGVIYAADKDDDPHDEATWFKANPSLGTNRSSPLKLSQFRADYEGAKTDPSEWPNWLRLRLNVWGTGSDAWIDELGGIHVWDAGEASRKASRKKRLDCFERFTPERLAGQTCYAGFDGATHHDTTALVFVFVDDDVDELVRVLPYYWLPESEAIAQQARVPYRRWAEAGHITLTPGDAIDFRTVLRDAVDLFQTFQPVRFYFDPLFQAEWFTQELSELTGVERCAFAQNIVEYTPPVKGAERLITLKKLRHNGHPILTWQVGHVQMRSDVNNNRRPVKRKKGDYRTIDGVPAMLMALRDSLSHDETGRTYYDDDNAEVEFI